MINSEEIRKTAHSNSATNLMVPEETSKLDVGHQVILYMEDVSVSFDGFKAIDHLNLYINHGELRCIIGPNGAGKTTVMDIITGKTRPDSGMVYFGQSINLLKMDEVEIANAGIGRKFQKPTVFENHTVFENLELAMHGDKGVWVSFLAHLNADQRDSIEQILLKIGLQEHAKKSASTLSHGQKQWLEIGMLLMQQPKLLLVDEPVSGMTHQEMDKTGELLTSLSGDRSVVVVDHDMDFVSSIARQVTVLHQGSVLAEGPMENIQNDPRVVEVYLGG